MRFVFECPSCRMRVEADSSVSGRQSHCPGCGAVVAVPEARVDCGTTLGGFRLERRLGKGGMGEVFLATQLSVQRQVAVKVLPPGFASNPEAVPRFLHEGQLAAKLDHANIVTVFEAGEDHGNYYLAMAYIEGETLDQRLRRERLLPEADALGIIRAIADALAYAWETFQLLHRDLKPANLMVDRRGRVFLMDLGLAKSLGDESGITLSGSILGTPQYMSPEQAQGLSDVGVPSDVYALGATLYHLVTGSPPFAGDTILRVLHQHLYEPLLPPCQRNPRVSAACSQLLEGMLAKRPAARYGDWRALIADLDRVLQGRAPVSGPAGTAAAAALGEAELVQPARLPPARPQQSPPKGVTAPTAPARPGWLTVSLVAATIVVLALIGVIVASRRGRPAPPEPVAGRRTAVAGPVATKPAVSPVFPPSVPPGTPVPGAPWSVPGLGLELVWVAPGSFQMGSDSVGPAAKPVHTVRISRGYWLGRHETTQAEYEVVVGRTPSRFKGARNPVELVSWGDAVAFCMLLTERERQAGRLLDEHEYRLPTEAEWEYAARGGVLSKGFACSGSDDPGEVAWCAEDSSSGGTHLVGQKQPNELGLHDMSGNVWEWCLDWRDDSYYARSPNVDPVNTAAATARVFRGGCWLCDAGEVRSAYRAGNVPVDVECNLGFRVGLAPVLPPVAP